MLISLPCQIVNAYYNLKPADDPDSSFPLPYPSWDYVHSDFGFIGQSTIEDLLQYAPQYIVVGETLRWAVLIGAYLAFACLGCSSENIAQLKLFLGRFIPWLRQDQSKATTTQMTVHVHTQRDTLPDVHTVLDDIEKSPSFGIYEMKVANSANTTTFSRDEYEHHPFSGLPTLTHFNHRDHK